MGVEFNASISRMEYGGGHQSLEEGVNGTALPEPVKEEILGLPAWVDIQVFDEAIDPNPDMARTAHLERNIIPALLREAELRKQNLGRKTLNDGENPLYDETKRPALAEWRRQALGTGLAIYTLDNARTAYTLGEGIDLRAFFEPCLEYKGEKISAFEYLKVMAGDDEAEKIRDDHIRFITQEIDHESRYVFSGSADAIGIRTRKVLAGLMAVRALSKHDKNKPVALASLGAGSAMPVIESVRQLRSAGYDVGKVHLFDQDPMALAVACSLLQTKGKLDADKIQPHLQQINFDGKPLEDIEEGSVDLVDAWGLAEYFWSRTATNLGRTALSLLRPGGTYLVGNMLKDRGQAEFFKLVNWQPKVRMRNPEEMVDILHDAGYVNIGVGVPVHNNVYLGYHGQRPIPRPSPTGLRLVKS